MKRFGPAVSALAATLVIVLAACGGGDEAPATTNRAGSPAVSPTTRPPVSGAPEGYETSCAAAMPWGQPLQFAFACVDVRQGELQVTNNSLRIAGYAAGSANNQVTIELRDPVGNVMAKSTVTYQPPAAGAIGRFETALSVPAGVPSGSLIRIVASFTNPGSTMPNAEGSSDVRLVRAP